MMDWLGGRPGALNSAKFLNRIEGKGQKCVSSGRHRAKKYRICDTFDMKYSNIYCPKHGFKSMDSQLDKFRRFECLEQYLNDRIRAANELTDQLASDGSDDNYEDIDEDYEYELELNRYNDQYINTNTNINNRNTNTSNNNSIIRKIFNCLVEFWYCLSVNQQFKEQMRKRRVRGLGLSASNSVSLIDRTSRILFPFVFFLLNLFYWVFLIIERNSEFKMWSNR